MDVEGLEGAVLRGFTRTLDQRRIEVVQFEYGRASILTKILLRDLYEILSSRGYEVGKIYPDHVEFREYAFAHEDFLGPNYLAVRKERGDLRRRLT